MATAKEVEDEVQKPEASLLQPSNSILEYYQKYSQNKDLPKYFCGTSISYMPQIVPESCELEDQVATKMGSEKDEDEKNKAVSPDSSLASTKKLEWDSGADIGYENYNKLPRQRSSSLPVLLDFDSKNHGVGKMCFENMHEDKTLEHKTSGTEKLTSTSSSVDVGKVYEKQYSSSSSSNKNWVTSKSSSSNSESIPPKTVHYSTPDSDSSSDKNYKKTTKFADTLAYLKHKIGSPKAESTPKIETCVEKPVVKYQDNQYMATPFFNKVDVPVKKLIANFNLKACSDRSVTGNDLRVEQSKSNSCDNIYKETQAEKLSTKSKSDDALYIQNITQTTFKQQPVKNLCRTTPLIVECIDLKKSPGHKKTQTSLCEKIHTSTQTEKINNNSFILEQVDRRRKQNTIYVEYLANEGSPSTMSSSAQTDVENLISNNCGSFVYPLAKDENEKSDVIKTKTSNKSSTTTSNNSRSHKEIPIVPVTTLKRVNIQPDLTNLTSRSSSKASEQQPLSDLITAKHSSHLISDINASLELLQKLIRSKKYNSETKKYYIKKIVKKIIESSYSDDSSTSSELFLPKKTPEVNKSEAEEHNYKSNLAKDVRQEHVENFAWYPANLDRNAEETQEKIQKKRKNLQINTSSTSYNVKLTSETPPVASVVEMQNQVIDKSSISGGSQKSTELIHIGSDLHNYPTTTSSSGDSKAWRDCQTKSERLYEQRKDFRIGQGDQIIQYAKKERLHQISWINNEINYLHRLKTLLERKPRGQILNQEQKVEKSEQNGGIMRRTTTVYMVSDNVKHGDDSSENSAKNSARNYVINTELSESIQESTTNEINLCLVDEEGQKQYTCQEMASRKSCTCNAKKITGDVKVRTESNTTNITVKAGRSTKRSSTACCCNKVPCVCIHFTPKEPSLVGEGVYQSSYVPSLESGVVASELYRKQSKSSDVPTEAICTVEIPIDQGKVSEAKSGRLHISKPVMFCVSPHEDSEDSHETDNVCYSKRNDSKLKKKSDILEFCPKCKKTDGCLCFSKACHHSKKPGKIDDSCGSNMRFEQSDLKTAHSQRRCHICNSAGRCICFSKPEICSKCNKIGYCMCNDTREVFSNSEPKTCVCGKIKNGKDICLCNLKCKDCGNQKKVICVCGSESQCQFQAQKHDETKICTCESYEQLLCKDIKNPCHKCGKIGSCRCGIKKHDTECSCSGTSCSCSNNSAEYLNTKSKIPQTKQIRFKTNLDVRPGNNLQTQYCTDQRSTSNVRSQTKCLCENKMSQAECLCKTEKVQTLCKCGRQESQKTKTAECTHEFKVQTDAVCSDKKFEVKCFCKSEELQTKNALDKTKEMQTPLCLCQTKEQQTPVQICKSEDQQTLLVCTDKNIQQTNTCASHENQTCNCNSLDKSLQADCRCCERGVQSNNVQFITCSAQVFENKDACIQSTCPEKAVEVIECPADKSNYIEISESSDSSTSSRESLAECTCCKKKSVPRQFSELRDKLSTGAKPLCHPCMAVCRRLPYSPAFNSPSHVCKCYTLVQTSTFNEIRQTVNELSYMEQREQYCTCRDLQDKKCVKYCKTCQFKLKNAERNKNGFAYMLNFEYVSPEKEIMKKPKDNHPILEEIKIKIPDPKKKKRNKEQENNKKKVKHLKDDAFSRDTASENNNGNASLSSECPCPSTLQQYLKLNRPKFIENAEKRRLAVLSAQSEKEENRELKKLLFIRDNPSSIQFEQSHKSRYFTHKEMRAINVRNYKKLPEVQQKLCESKEQNLKLANRFITEQFNEKLRAQVLRGNHSLPTDVSIVHLHCPKPNTK